MFISSLGLLCPGSCERTSCPDDAVMLQNVSNGNSFAGNLRKTKCESNQIGCNAETTGK